MPQPKTGHGVIIGVNVQFGSDVVVWNYVVIGDNTKIGDGTCIGSFCDIGKNVVIGKSCNIQAHVTISNECVLGDNVFIAPNSSLLNDKYPKSNFLTSPIVKDSVIIGGGVTILPGVVLGENSVIGGGSVVAKNVSSGKVLMGVPAKEVMTKKEYEAKREAFIRAKRNKGESHT
jgi:UDP-2-acetamido-3-amino-2,3-dideoxy-glucuronate N-acetyltransferase